MARARAHPPCCETRPLRAASGVNTMHCQPISHSAATRRRFTVLLGEHPGQATKCRHATWPTYSLATLPAARRARFHRHFPVLPTPADNVNNAICAVHVLCFLLLRDDLFHANVSLPLLFLQWSAATRRRFTVLLGEHFPPRSLATLDWARVHSNAPGCPACCETRPLSAASG